MEVGALGSMTRLAAMLFAWALALGCAQANAQARAPLRQLHGGSPLPQQAPLKILSTDPNICNITLLELFEANERRHRKMGASGNKQPGMRSVEIDLSWRQGILGQGPAAVAIHESLKSRVRDRLRSLKPAKHQPIEL